MREFVLIVPKRLRIGITSLVHIEFDTKLRSVRLSFFMESLIFALQNENPIHCTIGIGIETM